MRTRKIIKIAGFNIGIAVLNIILFSPGLVGLELGGASAMMTALGGTIIFMSVVVFVFGNYSLLTQTEKNITYSELKTKEDCIKALEISRSKRTFSKDIAILLEQIERLEKKMDTIKDILLQKFNSTEMSYIKFQGTVVEVEKLFYTNIRSILNKLNAFDEEDYLRMKKESAQIEFSKDFVQMKMNIYGEYIRFIKDSVEDNEEILLKLDKLLLELSKFNSLEDGEIENMNAMVEIDELISKTKFYK